MPVEDLGQGAAELLSLSAGDSKSLSTLAELAVRQVPGCVAAHASLWRDGELIGLAATHPDAAEIADSQIRGTEGPLVAAIRGADRIIVTDTLTETRWPAWADAALCRGIRCSVDLVRRLPSATLVLALFGVRAGALDADSVPMAEMLTRIGSAAFAGALAYTEAQRTATQLKDSVAARAITDQAKGILMAALGCDAQEALAHLRRESQRRHIKVTEVAAQVIEKHTGRRPR